MFSKEAVAEPVLKATLRTNALQGHGSVGHWLRLLLSENLHACHLHKGSEDTHDIYPCLLHLIPSSISHVYLSKLRGEFHLALQCPLQESIKEIEQKASNLLKVSWDLHFHKNKHPHHSNNKMLVLYLIQK